MIFASFLIKSASNLVDKATDFLKNNEDSIKATVKQMINFFVKETSDTKKRINTALMWIDNREANLVFTIKYSLNVIDFDFQTAEKAFPENLTTKVQQLSYDNISALRESAVSSVFDTQRIGTSSNIAPERDCFSKQVLSPCY